MWMIYGKLKGMEIPDSISESLKAEVGLVAQSPVVSQGPPKKALGNYEISLEDISPPVVNAPITPPTNYPALPPAESNSNSTGSLPSAFGPDGNVTCY
jgi:hypothetical protein